jgi:RNA polymerase-binding protein DksA
MPGLTPKDLERFELRLKKRREELRWLIHDALIESKREDYLELAGAVHDAAEESVADLIEGLNLYALDQEVAELSDVETALQRIADGVYGRCTVCGDDIALERLEAYPTAKRCITCQTKRENDTRGGKDYTPSL